MGAVDGGVGGANVGDGAAGVGGAARVEEDGAGHEGGQELVPGDDQGAGAGVEPEPGMAGGSARGSPARAASTASVMVLRAFATTTIGRSRRPAAWSVGFW
jgi:hypothetical protein